MGTGNPLLDAINRGQPITPADPLQVYDPKVYGSVAGLCLYGVVTAIAANQFTIPSLAGLGTGKFASATNPYWAFVLRKGDGTGAAPEGEQQPITAYDNGTGTFTAPGFGGGGVAIGDEILILHPDLVNAPIVADLNVPVANSNANVLERDVIGNKTDPAITVKDSVSSAMRYLKGLLDQITVARGLLVDRLSIITAGGAGELTAARAALLSNLDATISSRAIPGDAMTLTAAYNAAKTAAQAGDAMALLAAAVTAIRQSVCLVGDPAGSIGKLLNDCLDAAISSRAPGATALSTADWPAALATALAAYTAAKAAFLDIAISSRAPGATALSNADWPAALATALSAYTAAKAAFIDVAISSRASAADWTNALATALGNYTAALATALGLDAAPTSVGKLQIKARTFDVQQAGPQTYDLFTATTQDVVVEKLIIRFSGGAVGGTVTSISIQTDDATPQVIIPVTLVAVLTDEAQLAWTGAILLDAGTSAKIRLTIAGGAAGAANLADIIAEYRAVVAGGLLT